MNYYQEIFLLSNADIGLYFIWQKMYPQLHLAMVESKIGENISKVGVSFPEYDAAEFFLGTKLRLFAKDKQLLEDVQCDKWLNRLLDYVDIKPITTVPVKINGYACFRHLKLKGSKEKLARRRVKRKGETFEQALAYFSNYEEQRSRLPYINMTSQTNGQCFRLLIEKQQKEEEQKGLFSCYGLSNSSTVPLF